jgi:hypothetical protein
VRRSDCALERGDAEGFGQERLSWSEVHLVVLGYLEAVRRHEEHLHIGLNDADLRRQLLPGQDRHHEVREEQVDRSGVCPREAKRLIRIPRAQTT